MGTLWDSRLRGEPVSSSALCCLLLWVAKLAWLPWGFVSYGCCLEACILCPVQLQGVPFT